VTDNFFVVLDVQPDDQLQAEGTAREFVNRVQRLRKAAKLNPNDDITVYYKTASKQLGEVVTTFTELIQTALKQPIVENKNGNLHDQKEELIKEMAQIKIGEAMTDIELTLVKRGST